MLDLSIGFRPLTFGPERAHKTGGSPLSMAYVIVDSCTKDEHCIEACPVNCIHPTKDEADFQTVAHLYVNPDECIDCGACVPVCPTNSIFLSDEVPAEQAQFVDANKAYFG